MDGSPVPAIRADVEAHHNGHHRNKVEELFFKLMVPDNYIDSTERNDKGQVMIDKFWDEYEQFASKTGVFANRSIWDTPDIHENRSHVWHKKNSLRYTEFFGKFFCIVTSKILGIGSAESLGRCKASQDQ